LVNLLAAKNPFTSRPAGVYDPLDPRDADVLMPEYLTCTDKTEQLADHCVEWLTNADARGQVVSGMRELLEEVGAGGASQRAATYIARALAAEDDLAQPTDRQVPPAAEAA
jgi:hypothetical protein